MSRTFSRPKTAFYFRSRGLALVELMISLVLGLVIIGAVTGIMLSNMQGFQTTRGLSQVQDAARVGFELLARDIRQAGNVPCGNDITIVNILNPANDGGTVPWQYDWDNSVRGFDGDTALSSVTSDIDGMTSVDNQIPDTESLVMLSGQASNTFMTEYNSAASPPNFLAGPVGNSLQDGDILLVCNERLGTIFQMEYAAGRIESNNDTSPEPGNCSSNLGEFTCAVPGNVQAPYAPNTVIAQLSSTAWYLGDNGRPEEGGRSLYMVRVVNNSGNATLNRVEIASGVTNLTFLYRLVDTADFVDSSAIAANQWADVNAIQVSMTLFSQDQDISTSAADDGRLERSFTSVVAIRSRSL